MRYILFILFFISNIANGQKVDGGFPPSGWNTQRAKADVYDVRDWGFVMDGVTDNTEVFQALLDTIGALKRSATILLDTGTVLITGALQDITNSNSQLMLPSISLDSQTLVITIIGKQVPPNQFFLTSKIPTSGFSTIKSTLTGASGTASLISGHHEVGYIGPQNNVVLNVYNTIFQAPPNPSFTVLNLQYHQACSIDNVLIHAGSVNILEVASTVKTHSNARGIIFPDYNHTPCNNVGRLDVWGFYYGWRISERTDVKNVSSWACKYVGELGFAFHSSTFQVIGSYWCDYGLYGSGKTTIRVMQYQMENTYERGYDIVDPNNYITGDLVYELINGGNRRNHLFLKQGGENLTCDSLGSVGRNSGGDSSRAIQIYTGNYPSTGNFWIDPTTNRLKYKIISGDNTIVYSINIADSAIYSPPPPTVVIEDAFTGANATNLTAHTIEPTNVPLASWVKVGLFNITIQSNKASTTANGLTNYYVDSGVSDCTIEAVIQKSASCDIGIMFRFVDDGNYWFVSLSSATQTFKIFEKTANSYIERASTSKANSTGVDYAFKVVLSGNSITATIDDGSSINFSSGVRASETKHGLWESSAGATTITWDNFIITSN